MPGTADNGGEDGPGGVVSGEPGLAHPGPVVDDQRGNILVTHPAGAELISDWSELSPGVNWRGLGRILEKNLAAVGQLTASSAVFSTPTPENKPE